MKRFSSPLQYLKDKEGCTAYGGSLEFYEAGTSTPKTVFITDDSVTSETGFQEFGYIVPVDGFGLIPDIFGDGPYKVIAKDSDGVVLWERDNLDMGLVQSDAESGGSAADVRVSPNLIGNASLTVFDSNNVPQGMTLSVSAGSALFEVSEDAAFSLSGYYLNTRAISGTGVAVIEYAFPITGEDAAQLAGNASVFSCLVNPSKDASFFITMLDASDNVIATSIAQDVQANTSQRIEFTEANTPAIVSGGMTLLLTAEINQPDGNNIRIAEMQFEPGDAATVYQPRPKELERLLIKQYQNADDTLQANIDAEQQARIDADDTLQANIDAEQQARINADDALQANIDAEQQARIDADDTLQANIDAEQQARINADDALQANKADKAGDAAQTFEVADATQDEHAVNLRLMSQAVSNFALKRIATDGPITKTISSSSSGTEIASISIPVANGVYYIPDFDYEISGTGALDESEIRVNGSVYQRVRYGTNPIQVTGGERVITVENNQLDIVVWAQDQGSSQAYTLDYFYMVVGLVEDKVMAEV